MLLTKASKFNLKLNFCFTNVVQGIKTTVSVGYILGVTTPIWRCRFSSASMAKYFT